MVLILHLITKKRIKLKYITIKRIRNNGTVLLCLCILGFWAASGGAGAGWRVPAGCDDAATAAGTAGAATFTGDAVFGCGIGGKPAVKNT